MYFDAHVHLGEKKFLGASVENGLPENRWETYKKLAQKKSIFKALALPYPISHLDGKTINNYIDLSYRSNRELLIPFWLISNDISVSSLKNNEIQGFKEHFALQKYHEPAYFAPAYDILLQNNLFLVIHPHMSERAEKIRYLKSNFPNLKIILAHSGRKWPFTGEDIIDNIIPQLKKYDDLYFDTSTIRESSVITEMVGKLGSEKILFGSDYPYGKKESEDIVEEEIQAVEQAGITDRDKENILYKNSRNLFLKDVWVRRCSRRDKDALTDMISAFGTAERRYLALDQKMPVIRKEIRNERHVFVVEDVSGIQGFLRESGRPGNTAIIEEIAIRPNARRKGYAALLLKTLTGKFRGLEAKTYKENRAIASLLESAGFKVEKNSPGGNILYWKREDDSI